VCRVTLGLRLGKKLDSCHDDFQGQMFGEQMSYIHHSRPASPLIQNAPPSCQSRPACSFPSLRKCSLVSVVDAEDCIWILTRTRACR